jgi:TolB-like protein/DNA-binding winged helix-turn-helix (wHTH) protein
VAASTERSAILRFGVFELDRRARDLRKQGVRLRLQEQPFQVLLLLLERAGEIVTREELRQRLWPASVFVDFDHGLNNAIARVRDVLGDSATAPRFIETVPRVGYRFLEPVTMIADPVSTATERAPPVAVEADSHVQQSPGRMRRLALLALAGATLLAVAGLLLPGLLDHGPGLTEDEASGEAVPSIAIMPFVNMSSDIEDEYFSDGLSEELVNKLASVRGLRVVARTSSFRFKGKQTSSAEIAETLHVSHFLEGSVRRSGSRLRISAQLIDARDDGHVWSQTFDRELGDLLAIQEDIAFAVAAALKVSLLDAEEFRIRSRGTHDPQAYRLYVIAQAHLLGRTRAPDMALAKRLLDKALERDPEFAAAQTGLARYHLRIATATLSEESARLGAAAAARAVELDPAMSEALQARANFEFLRARWLGDYEAHIAGESDMQRAIELDPGNSLAFEDFGRSILWHEPELALGLLERAIQLDLLCTGPNVLISSLLGNRGGLESARERCADLLERAPDAKVCGMAIATLETYYGNFSNALPLLIASEKAVKGPARIQLWSIYMSMGEHEDAQAWLDFGDLPFEKPLSVAARWAMDGRYDRAFSALDEARGDFPGSRILDLPTARFALLAHEWQRALEILTQRLPDLVAGTEPISARNLLPAIDLATAQLHTGARDEGRALLDRIAAHLDGSTALQLPLFPLQRARVHALAGEVDAALAALDRAYDAGLRTTWALDLRPQSMLYVDPIEPDPAFDALRADPRFASWFERIRASNASELARQRAEMVSASPSAM